MPTNYAQTFLPLLHILHFTQSLSKMQYDLFTCVIMEIWSAIIKNKMHAPIVATQTINDTLLGQYPKCVIYVIRTKLWFLQIFCRLP